MSEMGKIACMHTSKIRRNIPLIEDDRYHDFVLDASAYQFRDGQWFVPDKPGWGLDPSPVYEQFARIGDETVIN
jgi:L-alanine-DL-glutamate epimerase-like enolase superfamily enzyme